MPTFDRLSVELWISAKELTAAADRELGSGFRRLLEVCLHSMVRDRVYASGLRKAPDDCVASWSFNVGSRWIGLVRVQGGLPHSGVGPANE